MKWEYMTLKVSADDSDIEKRLNVFGKKGWEVCGCVKNTIKLQLLDNIHNIVYTLKREL